MAISRNMLFLVLIAFAFAALAILIKSGHTAVFDEKGVMLLRGNSPTVIVGDFWQSLIANVTHLGDSLFLAIISIVAIAVLIARKEKVAAYWFLASASGSFVITAISKWAFGRERPEVVEQIVSASSASFPSGHTLRSAVVYSLIAYLIVTRLESKNTNIIVITMISGIILINGISRVYLGVHWPTDILGAWLIAIFWLFVCKRGYDKATSLPHKKNS